MRRDGLDLGARIWTMGILMAASAFRLRKCPRP